MDTAKAIGDMSRNMVAPIMSLTFFIARFTTLFNGLARMLRKGTLPMDPFFSDDKNCDNADDCIGTIECLDKFLSNTHIDEIYRKSIGPGDVSFIMIDIVTKAIGDMSRNMVAPIMSLTLATAQRLREEMLSDPGYGYTFKGFFSDGGCVTGDEIRRRNGGCICNKPSDFPSEAYEIVIKDGSHNVA